MRSAPTYSRYRVAVSIERALRRYNDALAVRLLVEEFVGFVGLVELPAVREEFVDGDLVVGDEFGAVGLALCRKGPRSHQRDLAAQEVRADIERDVTALANIAGGASRACGADGGGAEAICEAVTRPRLKVVPTKTAEQQMLSVPHAVRDHLITARTATRNMICSLLSEFGIIAPSTHN
jgi:hypothetical protein